MGWADKAPDSQVRFTMAMAIDDDNDKCWVSTNDN